MNPLGFGWPPFDGIPIEVSRFLPFQSTDPDTGEPQTIHWVKYTPTTAWGAQCRPVILCSQECLDLLKAALNTKESSQ